MQAATASAEEDDEDTDRGSSPMERTGEMSDYSGTWAKNEKVEKSTFH